MQLFHWCPAKLASGSIIEPGNFGRIVDLYGYKHPHYLRELALEQARQNVAGEAPSRLNCIFCFLTEQDARAFRFREHQGFATSHLYQVEAIDASAPVACVPIDALERWDTNRADELARSYWARRYVPTVDRPVVIDHRMPIATVFDEVVIGAPVRVLSRLD